jgi:hypothetical protein
MRNKGKLPCCGRRGGAQGSAARRFEFAARRWLDNGSPITAGLLIEDSVYWIACFGGAQQPALAVKEKQGLIGKRAIMIEGRVLDVCRGVQAGSGENVKLTTKSFSGARSRVWWGAHAAASNRLCKAAHGLVVRETGRCCYIKECRADGVMECSLHAQSEHTLHRSGGFRLHDHLELSMLDLFWCDSVARVRGQHLDSRRVMINLENKA